MKREILFILLILNITFILLPQATSGRGILRGTVSDSETGKPIAGVTVKLYSERADDYLRPFPVTGKEGQWKSVFINQFRSRSNQRTSNRGRINNIYILQ